MKPEQGVVSKCVVPQAPKCQEWSLCPLSLYLGLSCWFFVIMTKGHHHHQVCTDLTCHWHLLPRVCPELQTNLNFTPRLSLGSTWLTNRFWASLAYPQNEMRLYLFRILTTWEHFANYKAFWKRKLLLNYVCTSIKCMFFKVICFTCLTKSFSMV